MGKPLVDRAGIRYGSVVVVGRAPSYRGNARWCFKCDCGLYSIALGNDLQRGKVKSCGCENRGQRWLTHGQSQTPAYRAWQGMIQRCHNPDNPGYANYGGRGIKVCDRWKVFPNFYADMGARPGEGYSLDRIDNDRGYEPGNCRWTIADVQMNNMRRNRIIAHDGRAQTLAQWATEFGIHWDILRSRIDKYGWSIAKALTTPVGRRGSNGPRHNLTLGGRTQPLSVWAREIDVSPATIRKRLMNGWPLERALTEPRRW